MIIPRFARNLTEAALRDIQKNCPVPRRGGGRRSARCNNARHYSAINRTTARQSMLKSFACSSAGWIKSNHLISMGYIRVCGYFHLDTCYREKDSSTIQKSFGEKLPLQNLWQPRLGSPESRATLPSGKYDKGNAAEASKSICKNSSNLETLLSKSCAGEHPCQRRSQCVRICRLF